MQHLQCLLEDLECCELLVQRDEIGGEKLGERERVLCISIGVEQRDAVNSTGRSAVFRNQRILLPDRGHVATTMAP